MTLAGTGANRTLTVTPAANKSGTATVTVAVTDGIASTSDTFVLTVTAPTPTITITMPSSAPATATSPFLPMAGTAASDIGIAAVTWTTDRGATGTALLSAPLSGSGAPDTRTWTAEVPVPLGTTVVTVTALDAVGASSTATTSALVSSYVYYLAEGATGSFFDTELSLANPNAVDAPVQIDYLKADGTSVQQTFTLAPRSRATVLVDALDGLGNTAVSSVITSPLALPLAVERTMRWDGSGYGAHTEKATAGARTTWYFAEGSQGFFDTFLLLTNPGPTNSLATVRFLLETGTPVTRFFALGPRSRTSVWAGAFDDLREASFGISVTFSNPGVAERAMYFGASPFWSGGHESAGAPDLSTSWFHAEGATGPFFDTFILLSNPNPAAATVNVAYLLDSGVSIVKAKTIPANSRLTINVETEDPLLAHAAVATLVTSSVPIVSERAMYWAGSAGTWYEAHNSFGVTGAGTRWALGEGRVGGPEQYETYILLANPSAAAATVTVTYLREAGAAPVVQTVTVPPTSRVTLPAAQVAGLANERFGALIESSLPIVVERALYSSVGGVFWAAGTNATGTRIP